MFSPNFLKRPAHDVGAGVDAILIRALKGYAYQDKLRRAPRGAIDMGMLEELIKLFPRNGNAYAVIFLCVLRKSQAEKLRGGDAHMTKTAGGRCPHDRGGPGVPYSARR